CIVTPTMPSEDLREKRRPSRLLTVSAAVTLIGGSSYAAMVVGLLRSVLVMRLIGPRGRGIQRYAGIIKGYLANSSISWRHGVSKELPLAVGARDDERAAEIENAGFAAVSVVTAVCALALLAYALLLSPHDREMRIALAIGAGVLLAEELVQLYWCVLRSWSNFGPLAVGELVRTASYLALMVGGGALLGVTGVMLGWLGGALVVLLYLHFAARIVIRPGFDRTRLIRLFLVGLPIAVISFSDVLLRTVDGMVLANLQGEERLGLYAVAMQMATYLFNIPQAAGFVIWPKVLETYGAGRTDLLQRRRVMLPTMAAAAVVPVLGGAAFIALPVLVPLVVPDFAPAIPAAQALSLGATFLALPIATNAALVARNLEWVVVSTKLAGAAVVGVGVWMVARGGGTLVQVAYAACAGFAAAALLSLGVQMRQFIPDRLERAREMALAVTPLAWVIVALWASYRLVAGAGLEPDALDGAVLALFSFIVLSSPCIIYAHLRTGFGRRMAGMMKGRFRQE
ncbi:MAG: oligosaccharide flippase family protein, partial [Armatimonadetes bacterium]|nr:oligosaccharide flippase family protein [Armatimonadota bacterium]